MTGSRIFGKKNNKTKKKPQKTTTKKTKQKTPTTDAEIHFLLKKLPRKKKGNFV